MHLKNIPLGPGPYSSSVNSAQTSGIQVLAHHAQLCHVAECRNTRHATLAWFPLPACTYDRFAPPPPAEKKKRAHACANDSNSACSCDETTNSTACPLRKQQPTRRLIVSQPSVWQMWFSNRIGLVPRRCGRLLCLYAWSRSVATPPLQIPLEWLRNSSHVKAGRMPLVATSVRVVLRYSVLAARVFATAVSASDRCAPACAHRFIPCFSDNSIHLCHLLESIAH